MALLHTLDEYLPNSFRAGAAQYSTTSDLVNVMTADIYNMEQSLTWNTPQKGGGTNFDPPLQMCEQLIEGRGGRNGSYKMCVLLSDGDNFDTAPALRTAARLKAKGYTITGIFVGSDAAARANMLRLSSCGVNESAALDRPGRMLLQADVSAPAAMLTPAPTPTDQFRLETGFAFEGPIQCGVEPISARLIVTSWPQAARLQFFPANTSCAGEFTLGNGAWTSTNQTWALFPAAWVTNPCGYSTLGFRGRIDTLNGRQRFSGSLSSSQCTSFSFIEPLPTAAPTSAPTKEGAGCDFYMYCVPGNCPKPPALPPLSVPLPLPLCPSPCLPFRSRSFDPLHISPHM